MSTDLSSSSYQAAQRLPVACRLIDFLRAIRGVSGVTVSSNGLFTQMDGNTHSLIAEGFVPTWKDDSFCSFDQVGPHYFRVLRVPLIAGREFDEHDGASTSNDVVINETMAQFYFANVDLIERRLRNGGDRYTVIGVVKDMKEGKLKEPDGAALLRTSASNPDPVQILHFVTKHESPPGQRSLRSTAKTHALDPNLNISASCR